MTKYNKFQKTILLNDLIKQDASSTGILQHVSDVSFHPTW